MRIVFLLVIIFLIFQAALNAETFRVPQEYKDLGVALNKAYYGDTVLVSPGKYRLQAKLRSGVKLISTDGPDSTILWNRRWYILKLVDCDLETLVSGFTFEGRGSNISVACTLGAPAIVGNAIRESWDGITLIKSNAFVKQTTIRGCSRGIYLDYSNAELLENRLMGNQFAVFMISSSPVIARCRIEKNGRGIMILGHSYPTIGGMLTTANSIIMNGTNIYNEGLRIVGSDYTDQPEVAVATHNYWGSDCPPKKKFRGEIAYAPWTNAAHDTLFYECLEELPPSADQPPE